MKIGGNILASIEVKTATQNDIGEDVESWVMAYDGIIGWLDLTGGESDLARFNAKVQQSTHVFLCDYFPLVYDHDGTPEAITAENSRMIVNDNVYEVQLYDDPMELHSHFEIYLKFIGG